MRGKLMFLGGAAIGFVLGARAGREQYERLVAASRQLWDHPTVQEAAGVVQAQANRIYTEGKETVTEKLGNSKFGERHHGQQTDPLATGRTDESDPLARASRSQPGTGI